MRVAGGTGAVTDDADQRSVLVVEDDGLMRDLIARSLELRGFVVETAASAADAKRAFGRLDPDGAVIDIELGAGPNGFDLAEALRASAPYLAIVFLTHLPDARFVERDPQALPSGIAYLRKSALTDVDTLVTTLDNVMRGAPDPVRHDLDPQRPLASLTRKQVEVLRLIAQGLTNADIAKRRGVSVKAVEDTVGRICAVLELDAGAEVNLRVTAARRYLEATSAAT